MTRPTIDVTKPEVAATFAALTVALETASANLEVARDALESCHEKVAFDQAVIDERAARDTLFAAMEEHATPTVKGRTFTASVVERHDYVVDDENQLTQALFIVGRYDEFRTWDMAGLKKYASEFRKRNAGDVPGIVSVAKRFLQVRPRGE
jgi:hypothetical protein